MSCFKIIVIEPLRGGFSNTWENIFTLNVRNKNPPKKPSIHFEFNIVLNNEYCIYFLLF